MQNESCSFWIRTVHRINQNGCRATSSWNEVFTNTTISENYWTNETLENRFWRQFPAYYRQINVIRSKLILTSWRPRLKIWAYRLKFLGVFTPKRPLLKTLVQPQLPQSNVVQYSFKIWDLVATISINFQKINWPNRQIWRTSNVHLRFVSK